MIHVRSALAGGPDRAATVAREWLPTLGSRFPVKLYWFLKHGYQPHEWQTVFHASSRKIKDTWQLVRFRHLVAGRRGGKTLCAAWEVLFYALHPEEFHRDAHGTENKRPLWIWLLAKNHKLGRPQLATFLEVIVQAGLRKGKEYDYNKAEQIFVFYGPEGEIVSHVEVRSAVDPQDLRGAGLDILWIDEAAMLPDREAWDAVRPSLSDKLGLVITTTTPKGRNWFHVEFWGEEAMRDENQARVEYVSIDNPYFDKGEWEYARTHSHPVMFAQEYMASFDAMTGLTLHGDWLKYWTLGRPDDNSDDIQVPKQDGKLSLRTFLGVDPAISQAEDADHFAMALIGLTKDNTQAFLLRTFMDHLPFPEQIAKIQEWYLTFRPEHIGVESNAYQAALAQMTARMEGLPPIVPIISKGKKNERIIAMSPLFKIGKVRIHPKQNDFIEQWVTFDAAKKNQDDDLLDAVEIALGVAGVLLPGAPSESHFEDLRPSSVEEESRAQIIQSRAGKLRIDPELGSEF